LKLIKKISLFGVFLSILGCQSVPDLRRDSAYYSGFVGSTIRLHMPLVIASDKVSVYMQWGKLMDFKFLDLYQPSCKFEIRTMQQRSRIVEPDQFKIVRVIRDAEFVEYNRQYLASLLMTFFDNSPTAVVYSTELYLHSEKQPDVLRLTCSYWEDPMDASHLTVNQIQEAMGNILTLDTNQKDGAENAGI
jgi:hypothetical protein